MSRPSHEFVDWWKPKLRALDPWRELELHEIGALYAERETAPFQALALELSVVDRPAEFKVLLCGARGSGKSTELVRLAREVKDDYCVIQTDLAAALPDSASTLAIVTLLGVAALHAMQSWSNPDHVEPDLTRGQDGAKRLDSALKRFGDTLPSVAELLGGISGVVTLFNPLAGAAVGAGAAVAKAAGAGTSKLRHAFARGPLDERLPPERRDDALAVVDAVNAILVELEQLAGRPALLLADGLDKRTGVDEVELALSDEHLLRDLQAALVLTGPVNLRHNPRFRAVPGNFKLSLLYNVPVCARANDGVVSFAAAGVEVLCDLYERRRKAALLPEDMIAGAIVERAARMSSGIVRDFLGLLSGACKHALQGKRRVVSIGDLELAIKAQRLEMEGYLDQRAINTLRRVLDKGVLPSTEDADTLLFENFIACYPNGHVWFRPHELIVDFVQAHAAEA
jgi:hypothetical protein